MGKNLTFGERYEVLLSNEWKIAIAGMYGILFLTGTMGNLLVIYVFGWLKRSKRKHSELPLLALGICDLTTSIVVPPVMTFMTLSAGTYTWLILACQAMPIILSICITAQQVLLIVICYNRFRSVVTPLKSAMSWREISGCMAVGVALGIVVDLPFIINMDNRNLQNGICFNYSQKNGVVIWQLVLYNVRNIISFGVMAYFVRKMILSLRNSVLFRKTFSTDKSAKDTEEFIRTKKILYTVLVVFAICVYPTDIGFLAVFAYYNGEEISDYATERIAIVMSVVIIFQTINSSANVFIYSSIHPDFKKLVHWMRSFLSQTLQNRRAQDKSVNSTVELAIIAGKHMGKTRKDGSYKNMAQRKVDVSI